MHSSTKRKADPTGSAFIDNLTKPKLYEKKSLLCFELLLSLFGLKLLFLDFKVPENNNKSGNNKGKYLVAIQIL